MKNNNPENLRRNQTGKITKLNNYHKNYTVDIFINDLSNYFDNEVDFNLAKIRQEIEKPRRLNDLIKKASSKNTHPVVEFLKELFEDLGHSGDIKWSGEW